eukprot:3078598-Lingulodinium_polyedra.AAC.1
MDQDTPEQHAARGWLPVVDVEWARIGVAVNASKSLDEAEGAEIQGAFVDPDAHSVGLASD